jgi:N-acetylglucosamine-6-phosphate deacetylase
MKTAGICAVTGSAVEVRFDSAITGVDAIVDVVGQGPYIAPGFIDLQVNGFAGVDYNHPSAPLDEIARSVQVLFSTGVTRFLPTVITGPPEDMRAALANLRRARETLRPEGAAIEGFHVEGPHICPDDGPRGAHPRDSVRPPSLDEYRRWQEAADGLVKLVTLSPEWPEAPRYIETLAREGVVVAIGHTNADAAQIQTAVAAGATLSTHLGNGSHAMLPRHPNYLWEQLAEDRLAAGFIVDGIHIGRAFLKVALRAKGLQRSVLVTDASMPAACAPGRYRLGEQDLDLTPDGRVVLAGTERLAGSALRMNDGVANLMRLAGLSLAEAVTLATRNPARVGRIAGRQRGLTPGDRADLVRFELVQETGEIRILDTWSGGEHVYEAP